MSAKYNEDFKKEVVDAYIKSAKSYAEIAAEFNISKTSVRDWTKKYSGILHKGTRLAKY